MRIPRIFTPQTLTSGQTLELEAQASHHLSKVLRSKEGAALIIFNNQGGEFSATISTITKKSVTLSIEEFNPEDRQSPLAVHLGIALSKGDRMDWVMQKATELGAHTITPLYTERTELKLKGDRESKKMNHWNNIIIGACEQSKRNLLPILQMPETAAQWLATIEAEKKYVLHHRTDQQLNPQEKITSVALIIGPEGGLSPAEITLAEYNNFNALSLGPRVLRTETAPLAALSLLQFIWGDF